MQSEQERQHKRGNEPFAKRVRVPVSEDVRENERDANADGNVSAWQHAVEEL